jgi:hypothetical protein
VNDPVCVFPWPDHDPTERQMTTCLRAGFDGDRQAPPARTDATIVNEAMNLVIGELGNRVIDRVIG